MGIFLKVVIDDEACRKTVGHEALVDLCPVNIFKVDDGAVVVDDDRVDECTLCGLCWEKFPRVVRVEKLY
jgi:ferredoxin-like protein FixX